jgi:uncharacterized protein
MPTREPQPSRRLERFLQIILGAAFALTLASTGPTEAQGVSKPPSPACMASAREILAMKHAAPMYANAAPRIIQRIKGQLIQVNPEYEKYIDEIALVLAQTFAGKEKEIADNMARIYCTEFNEQDIAELVTFYKSSLGQKLLMHEPRVIEAITNYMSQWAVLFAATVSSQFRDEMRKRGKEI